MSKIMLFYNFKYVKSPFCRKKMPGSQKDIPLVPAMFQSLVGLLVGLLPYRN